MSAPFPTIRQHLENLDGRYEVLPLAYREQRDLLNEVDRLREALGKAYTLLLEHLLAQRLDDGSSALELALDLDPTLRTDLLNAIANSRGVAR